MFNQASFNQTSFNVPFDDSTIFLQTDAYETVSGMFGLAVIAYLDTNSSESISGQSAINAGVLLSTQSMENVTSRCDAVGTIIVATRAAEVINKVLELGASISLSNGMEENIQASAVLGAEYYLSAVAGETATGTAIVGCMAYLAGQDAYEIVTAALDIEAQDITELVVDIAIAPGQTLVIDSENYVVLLDGENVIARHSGGWAWLDRLVRSIQIDTGTVSDLQSSILYTERWL